MARGQQTASTNRSRTTERVPVLTTGHVNNYASDDISNYAGLLQNGIVDYYANDKSRQYITQRPACLVVNQASVDVVDVKGRGIYYWTANSNTYWMNDDVIYKNVYTAPCSMQGGDTAITSGSEKVYFQEWESANSKYLFIIDPENNGVYVINADADTTVINIADRSGTGTLEGFTAGDGWDFDALNAAMALGLCHGAVALDTYLFIGTTTARIYNSGVDDWLNWNGLDFLTCEREEDSLLFIGKSKDNIVAFGDKTIEIFYDNANATGSPLKPRTDITHQVGTAFEETVWNSGDDIHFMAVKPSGEFALATLRNFQIEYHDNPTMNTYLWQSRYTDDLDYVLSGYTMGGHTYVILNTYNAGVSAHTYVYDEATDVWGEWKTTIGSNTNYQFMGQAVRQATNVDRPLGIMKNGDIVMVNASLIPIDAIQTGATENITMVATTDNYDAGTSDDKFMHLLKYVGNRVTAGTLTVAWTDDNGVSSLSSTLDIPMRTRINRMGKFVSRKFTFTFAGAEQIRFEGVDVTITRGDT